MNRTLANNISFFRAEHQILGAMLLLLHLSIWSGFAGVEFAIPLAMALMTAHLGLFFLWQPIWQRDRKLTLFDGALVMVLAGGFILKLGWGLICAWIILLIGLVAGRSFQYAHERYAYMLTLLFLVSELLIPCVTRLFVLPELPNNVIDLFRIGLIAVPVAVALIPQRDQPTKVFPVDLFRGITLALMTAMLACGSLLAMYHLGLSYPVALFGALLGLAAFLFVISWLLSPHSGFSGLAQLWESSLLNIGTPFELWLGELARLAKERVTATDFLTGAMTKLVEIPWIEGISWQAGEDHGQHGTITPHGIQRRTGALDVTLYTGREYGGTLNLHAKLLIQVLGHFHTAKCRERDLAEQERLRAIFETGARVTHDIKNMLQSLQIITRALEQDHQRAEQSNNEEERRDTLKGQALFIRQLPLITGRLQLALDKLQAPQQGTLEMQPVNQWWDSLKLRNDGQNVQFSTVMDESATTLPEIPKELFDSVVENLLENARHKKTGDPHLEILVDLALSNSGEIRITVTDSGAPVPSDLAGQLFKQLVESQTGLGIGLYQAAKLAALAGFKLRLADNEPGNVCFVLTGGETAAPDLADGEDDAADATGEKDQAD